MSSYNKLESECTSTGWLVIPLYVEVATPRHINTTWGMITKALDTKKHVSKRLRLKNRNKLTKYWQNQLL